MSRESYQDDYTNNPLKDPNLSSLIERNKKIAEETFNPYDDAVDNWFNDNLSDAKEKNQAELVKTKEYAQKIASYYQVDFTAIHQAYTKKAQILNNIESTLIDTKHIMENAHTRFTMDENMLLNLWKKAIKYEKEISYLSDIEKLIATPVNVSRLIEQGNITEAVSNICDSIMSYQNNKFDQIGALADVKAKLDSTRQQMIEHVMDNIFSQLFVKTSPPNLSFFMTKDGNRRSFEIDKTVMSTYTPLLITLKVENDFANMFEARLEEKISEMMLETADSIKVKKGHGVSPIKEPFPEFVEIAESYSKSTSLVSLLDALLCKMYILLARCQYFDEITFTGTSKNILSAAWAKVEDTIEMLIKTFTSPVGSKNSNLYDELTYSFLTQKQSPSASTANVLSSIISLKPTKLYSILMDPLINGFYSQTKAAFQLEPAPRKNLDLATSNIITTVPSLLSSFIDTIKEVVSEHTRSITNAKLSDRQLKYDFHDVPICINTPSYIDALRKYVETAEKFPHLENTMIDQCIDLISKFKEYSNELFETNSNFRTSNPPYSARVLTNERLQIYSGQNIVRSLVIDETEPIGNEIHKPFEDFEREIERDLWLGKYSIKVDSTVRERVKLSLVATLSESMTVFRDAILEERKKRKLSRESVERFDKKIEELNQTIIKCCVFLRLDMRFKCYAEIVNALSGQNFRLDSLSSGPSPYVSSLLGVIQENLDNFSSNLIPTRYEFVVLGLPRLVYNLHLRFLPTVKDINDKGANLININLSSFSQAFGSFRVPDSDLNKKVTQFVSMIYLSSDRILQQLRSVKKMFNKSDIEPIFNMEMRSNENTAELIRELNQIYETRI